MEERTDEKIPDAEERPWAPGLKPTYTPLDLERSKLLLLAVMNEEQLEGKEPPPHFFTDVIDRRVEELKLPISFTNGARIAILSLIDRVEAAVVLLVDCLNAYEGRRVTVRMLADLYPTGFYDEETFIRYIDGYMKPRKTRWSEIY